MSLLQIRLLVYGAMLLAVASFAGYEMYQHEERKLAALQSEYDVFKGGVAALGKAAQDRKKKEDAGNLKRKQDADKENVTAHARDARTIAELRKRADDSRSSELPGAPSGSNRPDLLCLDRAEYQRTDGEAVKRLRQGARGLADEGTATAVDLNTARLWAQQR